MALIFANNSSLANITELPSSISGGGLNLISTQTASASASLEFSLDDSYDSYIFKFYDIHPATDTAHFTFQASTDNGSNYNTTITSTSFRAYHDEADGNTGLVYEPTRDQAQGTSFENLIGDMGSDNDQSGAGSLIIYNPSSNTFVKHFLTNCNKVQFNDYGDQQLQAGYFNTTSAITNLKFQMSSGNIDDGIIKMYGVS